MNKVKKLILGLGVAVSMAIAFVVGLVGINQDKPSKIMGNNFNGEQEYVAPKVEFEQSKPATITHAPNEIKVQKGGDSINYSYQPDNNSKDNVKTVAYEYCFGSTKDTMAVDIKSIGDTTGVNVSYIYSDTEIDTEGELTSYTRYDVQKINSGNNWKYVYIVVSAQDEVPTEFSHDIEWYYGKAGEVTIVNLFDNSTSTLTIVKGAEMQQPSDPTLSNGYNFMDWYLDKNCTTLATFPTTALSQTLYAKFPNLPTDYLAWDSATSSYYVKYASTTLPENLIIPANYNDGLHGLANVTYINGTSSLDGAFYNKTSLKSVELPETITSIGSYAFCNCAALTSITLPSSLTSIGDNAFSSCSGLTSIDLSGCTSLTSIGGYAFHYCSGLTSITLPSSLNSIGSSAFYACYALSTIYNLSSLNITAGSSSNGNVGYYAVEVYTDINTTSKIQTIGNMRYYENGTSFIAVGPTDRNITSIILDSRTTAINQYAFYGCSGLTSITLPSSLTSIGNYAFRGCSGLTSITLPSSLTSIDGWAFHYCSGLTGVYISDIASWCNISFGASYGNPLYYAKNLYLNNQLVTNLVITEGVTSIRSYAFYGCSGLTSITIPVGVTSIGYSAFSNCSGLESVVVEAGNTKYDSRNNCNAIIETATNTLVVGCKNTIIPNDITSIGSNAFYGCSGLTSIDLSGCTSLTSIGGYAFYYCSGLTSIDLSGCTSLTSIGDYAFRDCGGLTSIVIPASVTKIGRFAFQICTNLTSITFEDTTSTWYYTSDYNYTNGTEIDVSDASANATYFKSTYVDKYWYKV